MINVSFTHEEVHVMLSSIDNCLRSCHDGGPGQGCPDCEKLQGVRAKLQTEVG